MNLTMDENSIKQIIRDTLHEEIARYFRLDEMARVGFWGKFDVIVNTDDMGYIPHVHVIDKATRGYEFNTCIRLESNQYFLHGGYKDVFNSKQCKDFDDFMHQPCRNIISEITMSMR